MAYLAAQCNLESLHNQWKRSLCCQPEEQTTVAFKQLEIAVSSYIRKTAPSNNPKDILSVSDNLHQTTVCYTNYNNYLCAADVGVGFGKEIQFPTML